MTSIYVLRLQAGKFYVGKSENPMRRYQEHLEGKGSSWTRKYRPLKVEKILENASPFDEDKVTKEMMAKHGIENVRGGSYVTETLDDVQEEALLREIWGAKDCCTQCGRKGHFIADCHARTDVLGNLLTGEDSEDSDSEESVVYVKSFKKIVPNVEEKPVRCEKKILSKAQEKPLKVEKKILSKAQEKPVKFEKKYVIKRNTCFRCGREGHYADDCYARTNVKGYYLDSDED
jgi:predicted GIY-YIG superfamily endonuclease